MYSLEEVTESLKRDRATLVENLNTKEVEASENETFTSLAAKVLDIKSGGADLSEYFHSNVSTNPTAYKNVLAQSVKTLPMINTSGLTSFFQAFYNADIENYPLLDTSNVTDFTSAFANNRKIKSLPLFDTSKGTDFNLMLNNCVLLEESPQFDTSNGTDFSSMYMGCGSLRKVPSLNTSKGTTFSGMFDLCTRLTELGMLYMDSAININSMFIQASSLTTVSGFRNLGKGYDTTKSANYSRYQLDMGSSNFLTHDSAMNIINNLYDIATKGCQPQNLNFTSATLALLSETEIAIATNKGWNVTA